MNKSKDYDNKRFIKSLFSIVIAFSAVLLIIGLLSDIPSSSNEKEKPKEIEIVSLQTLNFVVDEENPDSPPMVVIPGSFEFNSGETYYVEWDNIVYPCTAFLVSDESGESTACCLGNCSSVGYPGNNEPFAIVSGYDSTTDEYFLTVATLEIESKSHSFRVYQIVVDDTTE